MSAPAPQSRLRPLGVIALGVLTIAILTPLTQLLTYLTVHDALETATPVGWAVGAIFSLVLAFVVLRRLGAPGLLSKPSLALLYAMLALSVPLMNLGLVRPFYLSLYAVYREYLDEGNNTYRTAYAALDEDWSPKIPTREGMASLQVDRLLLLLSDRAAPRTAAAAQARVDAALTAGRPPAPADIAALSAEAIEALARDQAAVLAAQPALAATLETRRAEALAASSAALAALPRLLGDLGEPEASFLPATLASLPEPQRRRLADAQSRWSPETAAAFAPRLATLVERADALRTALGALTPSDRLRLRRLLRDQTLTRLQALDEAAFDAARAEFVLRLSRTERQTLFRLAEPGAANDNLRAFRYGLWDDPTERQAREQRPLRENFTELLARIPWSLFLGPVLRWALLFTAIFLFLMCLAEWLRRKWVERENLAFPLVEFADHLIRHDFRLELSADVQQPEPRKRPFYPLFWVGFAVGAAILLLDVLGHYGWTAQRLVPLIDLNEAVFNRLGGAFRQLPALIFFLSPVVVGIAYLLSLQLSFSIWVTFLLYTVAVWGLKLGFPDLRDSNYTGFEGGKLVPFAMEQLVGAAAVFSAFLLWQVWRTRRSPGPAPAAGYTPGHFVAPWPTRLGLVLLPPLILWLLWDLGVRHVPLLLLFAAFLFVQTLTVARARAETGLPPIPAFFESTKLPMIFGLTGSTGAKVFTSFVQVVFLPATLLFRTLPQHLENIELARRHRLPYRWMALGSVAAFATALVAGLGSFLLFAYWFGSDFYADRRLPPFGPISSPNVATAPLWVAHFLGEPGLAQFDTVNWLRMGALGAGAAITAALLVARQRFLSFPLHPLGYLVTLLALYFAWGTPYVRPEGLSQETSVLWGGVFLAWLIKLLVVKYGGMHTYKRSKPLFIGLIVGAVFCLFLANLLHLGVRLWTGGAAGGSAFFQAVLERSAYSPLLY